MHPLPLARFDEVSAGFGDHLVFSGLSLSIYPTDRLALLGPNGAGKSTLLRLLQGDLRPAQHLPGRIVFGFAGKEETSVLAAKEHVRTVSPALQRNYVRQGWKITGEEILLSGLDNAAMVYGELSSRHYERAAALAESAGAAHLLAMPAPAMSQGQLRLALILRALMSAPALLLLDEPFDGLDAPAREQVTRSIRLAMERSAVLISAHRREDIPDGIREALLLEDGGVRRVPVEAGADTAGANAPPDENGGSRRCKAEPGGEMTGDASRTGRRPSCPDRTGPDASLSDATGPNAPEPGASASDASLSDGAGPDVAGIAALFCDDSPFTRLLRSGTRPLLQLEHVDVFIERGKVLSDICWTVNPGEQWIVSGRNGSGKSTLLRLLYGEEFAAYGGTLSWCGRPRPALDDLRRGVGYVSDRLQDVYDYDLCARDVVVSGLDGSIGLYRDPSKAERETARFWLERMGLAAVAAANFHSLSSGTMRRVLLARALAGSPPVLLLDEPLSGLDGPSRRLFLDALPGLAARGVHMLYVSHHEEDKSGLFTHELRLEQGRVAYAGPRHAAF